MRHFGALSSLLLFLAAPVAWGKTPVSVVRFLDKSEESPCLKGKKGTPAPDLGTTLQNELIAELQKFERFVIKEREVRPVRAMIQLRGEVREFANCRARGEHRQKAAIAIDVRVLNAQGSLTHVFTSNASVTGATGAKAAARVIQLAVAEIARRLDTAMPGQTPLPLGKTGGGGDYSIQLIKKPRLAVPVEPSRRPASVASNRRRR